MRNKMSMLFTVLILFSVGCSNDDKPATWNKDSNEKTKTKSGDPNTTPTTPDAKKSPEDKTVAPKRQKSPARPDVPNIHDADILSSEPYYAYYNKTHEFSITFPAGWTVKTSGNRATVIKAVFRDSQNRISQIAIAAYPLGFTPTQAEIDELTPDEMWESLKEQFPDFDVKRHDSGTTKIRSRRAVWNLVETTDPPQARMISKHFHLVNGSNLYRVTAVSDSGSPFFRSMLPVMEKSIETLAFGL